MKVRLNCYFQIYDVTTGRLVLTFQDQDKANNYTRNRATFNPTDDLVLNDGVLWDVNSGKAVHKFDKFNPNVSGVFHPMGLEIIINSEVVSLLSVLGYLALLKNMHYHTIGQQLIINFLHAHHEINCLQMYYFASLSFNIQR